MVTKETPLHTFCFGNESLTIIIFLSQSTLTVMVGLQTLYFPANAREFSEVTYIFQDIIFPLGDNKW